LISFNSDIFPKTERAYIIGGSVRDVFLERNPADYDIAVERNPEEFAKKITSNTTGHIVEIGRPGQKVVREFLKNT